MLSGPYLRAAVKAEIKRARARGQTNISAAYLRDELGMAPATHESAVRAAVRELDAIHIPPAKSPAGDRARKRTTRRVRAHQSAGRHGQ